MENKNKARKIKLFGIIGILALLLFTSNAYGFIIPKQHFVAPLAFIPNYRSDNVSVIDARFDVVVQSVDGIGAGAFGIAVDPIGRTAYVTTQGIETVGQTVTVIDTKTFPFKVIDNINVGKFPSGIAFNPQGTRVYVANSFDGTISVIDTAKRSVIHTVNLGLETIPVGVVVNPTSTKVYVTESGAGKVSVINTATNTVENNINVGNNPYGITMDPKGTKVYVANLGSNNVSIIDTATNSVTTLNIGGSPREIAVNPDGTTLYVTNAVGENTGTVEVFDVATNKFEGAIPVGKNPVGISVNLDGSKVYVANSGDNTVSVINAKTFATTTINVGQSPMAFGKFF